MDSPYTSILHTNTVPSDTECKRIRELLIQPCREAAELREEIQRLQQKLESLDDSIDAHRALVSPARRIPDDIVQEIFKTSLPPQNSAMSSAESPLLLCHICKAWRNLALHTPALWTSLHIVAPAGNHSAFVERNDVVDAWLSRSGSLPLSISCHIVYTRTFGVTTEAFASIILETLIRYSHRWQHVRFVVPNYTSLLPLATLNASDVPILQSVSIKGFTYQPGAADWRSISFINAPTVTTASFAYDSAHLLQLPLCWGQLRHISLRKDTLSFRAMTGSSESVISTGEILTMLTQCPLLETFAVTLPIPVRQLPEIVCRMERLQQLYVTGGHHESAPPFFSRLELPVLRRLEYQGNASIRDPLPFLPLLASTNTLESLGLNAPGLTVASVLDGLRLVPTLQELQLVEDPKPAVDPTQGASLDLTSGRLLFPEDRSSIIALLMARPDDTGAMLCPQLRRVSLQRFRQVTDKVLLEFIRARAGTLSDFRASFFRGKHMEIIPPLQDLIADGLKVSLEYTPINLFPQPSTAAVPEGSDWRPLSLEW